MAGEDRIGAGFKYIFYGVADSSGYLQGNSATAATHGTIQPMVRLRGARTFPVTIPERDRVPVSGDDEPLVTFSFPSEQLPNGVMSTATKSLDFEALCKSTSVESFGDLRAGSMAAGGEVSRTMMLLLQREAKKYEGATKGVAAWEIILIPSCEINPTGAEWEQRTFNPYNYSISISKAGIGVYGGSYTEATRGTTEVTLEPIEADNPVMIEGGYGDGATSGYTLNLEPVAATAAKVHVWLDNVKQTYTTHYTVTGTGLNFVSPPGDGVHIGVMYEVAASALS
jgi:hypothetical protein